MMQTRRHNRILIISISLLSLIIVYGLAGCSDHRYYADSEEALDTSGYYDLLDHIAAYYPNGVSLNFPGYIVGFEESDRSKVTSSRDDVLLDESVYSAGYTIERLVKALRYNVPYISQVMHYQGRPYGEGNCALYNLYHNHGTTLFYKIAVSIIRYNYNVGIKVLKNLTGHIKTCNDKRFFGDDEAFTFKIGIYEIIRCNISGPHVFFQGYFYEMLY